MLPASPLRYCITVLACCCIASICSAQLTADFTTDKTGGCSPVIINFTNSTTGASAQAIYKWDFGNGNTASSKDASAIFQQSQQYNVTLTVTDSGRTSSRVQAVTVYKKPIVDFAVSASTGCAPLTVSFTSNSSDADGNIVNYFWDFGDGSIAESGSNQISHTYLSGQMAAVILAVTNDHGCSNNKTINNMVDIKPGTKALFEVDKTFLCLQTDTVKMINQSTGLAPLIYNWNFGDNTTSTEANPAHVFNQNGAFTLQLIVKNTFGCADTLIKSSVLNVANFRSEITVQDIICNGSEAELKNTSLPVPSSFVWVVDGADTVNADPYGHFIHRFTTAGNHTIRLTNTFGSCTETVTKIVDVKKLLDPKGFIAQVPTHCFTPVTVAFTDTTVGAVTTAWNFERTTFPIFPQETGVNASYTFTQPNNWLVTLFVTDVNGCTDTVEQYVNIIVPDVQVVALDSNNWEQCTSVTKKFGIVTTETITSYNWDFGNGATATVAEPTYTFTNEGAFLAVLHYTTASGCSGTAYSDRGQVFRKPVANFSSISGTTICGNSIVTFERDYDYYMYSDYYQVDGLTVGSSFYSHFDYQFLDTGIHTITLVVNNFSNIAGCADTMTRVDYIHVIPSFPKITEAKNTCDGDRGTVTFKQNSRYAEQFIWDFGDGDSLSLSTNQETVQHTYSQSGNYWVVLSTINGPCKVKDSVYISVQLKQPPVLSIADTSVCVDEGLTYKVTNLSPLIYTGIWVWAYVHSYQYNDGTAYNANTNDWDNWIHSYDYSNTFKNLALGKTAIRIVIETPYFNCFDTSNFVLINISGAAAGFSVLADTVCFPLPVIFTDTSRSFNANIINHEWNFGDGTTLSTSTGGIISHQYAAPGAYPVTLKITDDGGCTATTSSVGHQVVVNGPMAALIASATNVQLNTTVQFTNTTNSFNNNVIQYQWSFGDGDVSTDFSPSHTYNAAGTYRVRLIASGMQTGCADTAFETITVSNFIAGFSFSKSFIQNGNCPPVLFKFTNTSVNYTYIKWDFGDGTVIENVDYPSHLYTSPGVYMVTLFVKGYNGLQAVHTDSITIKSSVINVHANPLHSCTAQMITLNAAGTRGISYLWDFGDGTVSNGSDTFATHNYKEAGIYNAAIIATDSFGCATTLNLPDKIVIDSLYISLQNINPSICAPKNVLFNPVVVNNAADQGLQVLLYHWDFGTGNIGDTSNSRNPSFTYQQPGSYPVSLKVQSPYGCNKEASILMTALQGLGGQINGPAAVCKGTNVQFTGSTLLPGQPQWKWIFDDGSIVQQQNPPARLYNDTGLHPVKLIVNNQGCSDTVTTNLLVNQNPFISLSSKQILLCEGSQAMVTAGGGISYSWSPLAGVDNVAAASVTLSPVVNTTYLVNVTDANHCSSKDSVAVSVVHPFTLMLSADTMICSGKSMQLSASGANNYVWIQNTTGLNSTSIANPIASPLVTTNFTVKATGANNCFTDTATIKVTVAPTPTVDAGQALLLFANTPYQLQPSASNDVVGWSWSPANYLSCSDCNNPFTTPQESLVYTITVNNAKGCKASDTVSVNLLCSESRVYIPTAFSPDGNGTNDVFAIRGNGIRIIHHLAIFNRYGELVFERTNFQPDGINGSWDGRYKGELVPAGSYVYIAEMSCNERTFTRKGSVTVIY